MIEPFNFMNKTITLMNPAQGSLLCQVRRAMMAHVKTMARLGGSEVGLGVGMVHLMGQWIRIMAKPRKTRQDHNGSQKQHPKGRRDQGKQMHKNPMHNFFLHIVHHVGKPQGHHKTSCQHGEQDCPQWPTRNEESHRQSETQ